MNQIFRAAAATAALLGLGAPAGAATTFLVSLTNAQEVGSVTPTLAGGAPRPASFGDATLVLNDAQTALSYSITVFNIDFTGAQTADINDNLVAAHVHAGPLVTPGVNGPVVFGFFGSPFNDNNPNDVVFTPFATGVGGMISGIWNAPEGNGTTLAAQIPNLLAGRAYLNFHTVQFGGGEIRGDLSAVPESATWAMLIVGFGLAGIAIRQQRRIVAA